MRAMMMALCAVGVMTTEALARRVDDPLEALVSTASVDDFFRIYDAAAGKPTAADLAPYISEGGPGVQGFIPNRIRSATYLARTIEAQPRVYAEARDCAARLGDVHTRVRAAFLALEALYPAATYPQTFILIGAGNSGGTANENALMIGLEVVCRMPDAAPLDVRLTHFIAHELAHSLQRGFAGDTLLARALHEGAAEFIAELATGRPLNGHLADWTRGREGEIEQRFAAAMDGTDTSGWLYNGIGTPAAPGDLGYWVGHRIAAAYYARQPNKRRAVAEILAATDARAFLAASGWTPAR